MFIPGTFIFLFLRRVNVKSKSLRTLILEFIVVAFCTGIDQIVNGSALCNTII